MNKIDKLKTYISDYIEFHLESHRLAYKSHQIDDMVDLVLSGVTAFRIIYNSYNLLSWNILDHHLLCFIDNDFGRMYSYDGGKRFQWNETETIVLDKTIMRKIKLDNILD